jgi:hypothetical protein
MRVKMSSLENSFDYQQLYFLIQIPICICWTGGRVDPSFSLGLCENLNSAAFGYCRSASCPQPFTD